MFVNKELSSRLSKMNLFFSLNRWDGVRGGDRDEEREDRGQTRENNQGERGEGEEERGS